MPSNFGHKTEIFGDPLTPGEIWRAVQELKEEDFPVLVKYDNESVHLFDQTQANIFGLGVHFGSLAHAGMFDNPDL